MKTRKIKLFLTAALIAAAMPTHINAEENTETVSYNYVYDIESGYSLDTARARRMEKLGRGLAAAVTDEGVYLSWRLLDSEDHIYGSAAENVSFNVYRDGGDEPIANVSYSTNYIDRDGGSVYSVAPVTNGVEGERCEPVKVNDKNYIDIETSWPEAAVLPDGSTAEYVCGGVSCGDLDGDGEYELVVSWVTSFSSSGMYEPAFNDPVLLDAYELDGTRLWDSPIDLGPNIFTDQHNMQLLVYDLDGDGTAEITCQTSAGTKDAEGVYVSEAGDEPEMADIDNSADYRDENGRTYAAPELFTVFDGADGTALDTIYYPIGICAPEVWGDMIGNRSTRFLADISYLDGERPYAVYWRGYYFGQIDPSEGRTGVFGASFDGESLDVRYVFDTFDVENSVYGEDYRGVYGYTAGNELYIGQGNHNITTADTDNDGKDEVISGSLCLEVNDEDKLMPKWCSFRGHGDALHIGDYDPTHIGLEYFSVHETGDTSVTMPDGSVKELDYGMTLYDAADGEELFHVGADKDTGSGLMLDSGQGGYFQMTVSTGVGTYIGKGEGIFEKTEVDAERKYRIFWDGDLYDEIAAQNNVYDWNGTGYENIFRAEGCVGINPGGHAPLLQADLFGDWREELIYPLEDKSALRLFFTVEPTNYKMKTLMHDPVYRSGAAAEQTATNTPPHVGFYIGEELFEKETPELRIDSLPYKTRYTPGTALRNEGLAVKALYENGSAETVPLDECRIYGFEPDKAGAQTVYAEYLGQTVSFDVTVNDAEEIFISREPDADVSYLGAPLNTEGLEVSARYADGAVEALLPDEYDISYAPDGVGRHEVTVTYEDMTASFEVTAVEAGIGALNRNYYNAETESSLTKLPVGALEGDFTVEHSLTVKSMSADCSADKNDTNGFFLRFINSAKNQIGGGWYLSAAGDRAAVSWKSAPSAAAPVGADICEIDIGETYTFRYEFFDVGTLAEKGAYVNMEVIDGTGAVVGRAEGLDMRNFSQTNYGKECAVTDIQVYNQAKSGSAASVSIGQASAYGGARIIAAEGTSVKAEFSGVTGSERVTAAEYENGVLTGIKIFDDVVLEENTFELPFEPDRIFVWSGMRPLL